MSARGRFEIIRETFVLLRERKKWWLLPILIFILVFGILVVISGSSAIAPFIYTLF